MKKIIITFLLGIIISGSYAQAPQAFNYQAVVRDLDGNVLANQNVTCIISILQGSPQGEVIFDEWHGTNTNETGLMSLEVGYGEPGTGTFSGIDWANGPFYLQLELDPTGGENYQLMGTTQLLSVPYSLYSVSTGDTTRWRKNNSNDLYYNDGYVGIGTDEPAWWAKLDVDGNVNVRGRAAITRTDDTEAIINIWNTKSDWEIVAASDTNRLMIREWEGEPVFNILGAKVGIGTATPEYDLDIHSNSTNSSRLRLSTHDYSKSLFFSSGNESYDPAIYFQGGDALRFMRYDGGYNELMRITSDGKIGIGITDPFYNLEIMSNATDLTSKIRLSNLDDSKDLRLSSGSDIHDPHISFAGADALRFMRWDGAYNEFMRITSEGKIGIGTTSPSTLLEVAGTIKSNSGGFMFPDGSVQTTAAGGGAAGNTLDQAYDQGGPGAGRTINADNGAVDIQGDGGLTVNGNVGIGTATPVYPLSIHPGTNSRGIFIDHDQTGAGETIGLLLNLEKTYSGDSDIFGSAFSTTNNNGSGSTRGIYSYAAGTSTGMKIGVYGSAQGSGTHYGVAGSATGSGIEYGVYGSAHGTGTLWAGYFGNGDVHIANNLGIGTESPSTNLVVKSSGYANGMIVLSHDDDHLFKVRQMSGGGGGIYLYDESGTSTILLNGEGDCWVRSGRFGVGTVSPKAPLHVEDRIRVGEDPSYSNVYGELIHEGGGTGFKINSNAGGGWADMHFQSDGETKMFIESGGNVGIGTTSPASRLDVQGNVTIRDISTGDIAIELGKGLDYAEGFNVTGKTNIQPGTILCIDPENPGKLMISEHPYDKTVAGIVAGANGLGSGIRLGTQEFDCDVALAGRVYCNTIATTENIEPGDLLTTSSVSGFAMKVTDFENAQGAIIGKAMEKLEKGKKGQILVLVTLQ